MVQDYSDYSEILLLILTMFLFEFISTFEWNNIYFYIQYTYISLFMYLFGSKMMIYSKNMICKKFYRKMFNKHEIRY